MSCGSVQFFEAHYTKDQDALMKLLSGGATCDVVDSNVCSTQPRFALVCPESCAPDKLKERGRGCNAETCPPPGTCHGGVGGRCWTTDKDWKKLANTQCTEFLPHDPMLTDIASAEIKCLRNPNCGGVSDLHCNGMHKPSVFAMADHYALCKAHDMTVEAMKKHDGTARNPFTKDQTENTPCVFVRPKPCMKDSDCESKHCVKNLCIDTKVWPAPSVPSIHQPFCFLPVPPFPLLPLRHAVASWSVVPADAAVVAKLRPASKRSIH